MEYLHIDAVRPSSHPWQQKSFVIFEKFVHAGISIWPDLVRLCGPNPAASFRIPGSSMHFVGSFRATVTSPRLWLMSIFACAWSLQRLPTYDASDVAMEARDGPQYSSQPYRICWCLRWPTSQPTVWANITRDVGAKLKWIVLGRWKPCIPVQEYLVASWKGINVDHLFSKAQHCNAWARLCWQFMCQTGNPRSWCCFSTHCVAFYSCSWAMLHQHLLVRCRHLQWELPCHNTFKSVLSQHVNRCPTPYPNGSTGQIQRSTWTNLRVCYHTYPFSLRIHSSMFLGSTSIFIGLPNVVTHEHVNCGRLADTQPRCVVSDLRQDPPVRVRATRRLRALSRTAAHSHIGVPIRLPRRWSHARPGSSITRRWRDDLCKHAQHERALCGPDRRQHWPRADLDGRLQLARALRLGCQRRSLSICGNWRRFGRRRDGLLLGQSGVGCGQHRRMAGCSLERDYPRDHELGRRPARWPRMGA